jgi:hypothetical protein
LWWRSRFLTCCLRSGMTAKCVSSVVYQDQLLAIKPEDLNAARTHAQALRIFVASQFAPQ